MAALDVAQLAADHELQLAGPVLEQVQEGAGDDQVILAARLDGVDEGLRRVAHVDRWLVDTQGAGALRNQVVHGLEGRLALDREGLGDDIGHLRGVDELGHPVADLAGEPVQELLRPLLDVAHH